ncbi:Melibiose operon regulatory protein [Peribacillus sp. Bi96]|uniref:AraC family transcriptional regulator n=1 Tax=unclassified Peribacillus TaxID=2675266 RepID=UPI001DE75D68|nr:AraC family transcriptional regulator [Peribacillus sp. Bi96]CAH0263518.1 Melibiose operon regulatory protein [Peribacillus sp. Bi96]
MSLQKCGLNLNRAGKELQPHGTFEFPCAGYSERYTDKPEDFIPWHWHEEIEIVYVKDGVLKLQIPAKSFHLKKGDCIVIKSNIPHYAMTASYCELQSLVFNPMLITGNKDSVFANKFMLPLISCTSFDGYLFRGGDNEKATNNFISAFEALAQNISGFEFIVREKLSNLCFFLYQQFEKEFATGDMELDRDNFRIRKMLNYIHNNFSEDLTLVDIAKVADIGERECLRCFQRTIQLSPIQYLLKYRIMQGADFLLKNPANSISEISSLCGIDSPSNFSKMFKRFYNCTPREYRNLHMI